MGQAGSKATRGMRLPRNHIAAVEQKAGNKAQEKAVTREQMLAEEEETEAADSKQNEQLQDNLKYFINPKELVTPITPANPSENANVRALRNRREEDEVIGTAFNRAKSSDLSSMLRELRSGQGTTHQAQQRAAAKYNLDEKTVAKLVRFLEPA
ncbi:hypothetical protein COEREDRAFT_11389 [Coemansia reversa NRRL 1564]|uniref:Uncharacterized protein n=1 Tax=Coemansia reversa (strain ATCC 12441 / NRRL 1564) TaxID=763665 RepID=A0A2G5B375_COERN|nr:hypothetical protein COEREDRAFT_11389 [Coemansia reversa NRRL 1564]|eukprot:PIA13472.1 hypothetical protein COEREDRAFT_11389 [Coemansia reversa NRRL 1564]